MKKRIVNKTLQINNKERNWKEIIEYFWYKFLKKALKKARINSKYCRELKALIFFNI